ncbi:MAG: methionyl-tRNA formyltransferase [Rickettsiales bacterium]
MTRIVFMGTPDFAVPSLEALHRDAGRVVAAFSQPPRPAGRGKKLAFSPVHQACMRMAIPCFTPTSLKEGAHTEIVSMRPDFIAVAAYGLILPKAILDIAPCINVHASLLPRWRGAAPVHRAIMEGDEKTGVTIMRMNEGLDAGGILLQESTPIAPDANASDLTAELAHMGARLIVRAVLQFSSLRERPQPANGATYAAKISKEESTIDWTQGAKAISDKIRALAPYPGARLTVGGEEIKILRARPDAVASGFPPGTIINDRLHVACGNGVLIPEIVQRPGKKMMAAEECARGLEVRPAEK